MAYLFRGDFETGDASQWDGLSDETTVGTISGLGTVVSSYTAGTGLVVRPNAGSTTVAMAKSLLKPQTGSQTESRAEQVKNYDFASYYQKSIYFTFAFLLDPDYTWTGDWTTDATNIHWSPVILQALGRNLFASDILMNLHPSGWQGETGMCVSLFGKGGLSAVNSPSTGTAQHRLACDPTLGNGWTTLLAPATAESTGAQRFPQILGPHCQQGQNIPVTVGEWWEIIFQVDCYTDVASGGYTAWVRKKGSGPVWTKTLDTARIYKTVQYYPGSQPANSSGPNNVHRVGGYVYGLPANRQFFWDQFTVSDSFTDAQLVFFDETGAGGGGGGGPLVLPTFEGFGAVEGSTSTLTPTMPTGILPNDVLILVCESKVEESVTLATANGFAQAAGSPQEANIGGGPHTTVFWKRAVGSDSAPVIADPGDHVVAVMLLFRGCKTSGDAWNTYSGGNSTQFGSTAIAITGSTTDVANCLVVIIDPDEHATVTRSGWTNADLANIIERVDAGVAVGTGGSIGVVTGEKAAAGTYGTTTATRSANSYKAWVTLALEGAPSDYQGAVLGTSGLQSLWMLDEALGSGTVVDSKGAVTGTTFHCTLGAAGMLPSGKTSCSLNGDLGGTNGSNISFGDVYDFAGAVPFSVEMILNATTIDATARRIMDKGSTGTSGWEIQVDSGAGGITFERFGSGFDNSATQTLTAGTLAHLVCTYDGAQLQVWVNNSPGAAVASTGSLAGNTANLILGNRSDELRTFAGLMQAVAIYNVALSPSAITDHYNRFVGGILPVQNSVVVIN